MQGTDLSSPETLPVPVQKLRVASQGAEVTEDRGLRATHVIH